MNKKNLKIVIKIQKNHKKKHVKINLEKLKNIKKYNIE